MYQFISKAEKANTELENRVRERELGVVSLPLPPSHVISARKGILS